MALFRFNSNLKSLTRKLFPSERERVVRVRAAMKKVGRMYIAQLQRKYMSGRPGLNRRTGLLVRTWYHDVHGSRMNDLTLTVWTPTYYAGFHSDDPQLRAKKMPIRLWAVREWRAAIGIGGSMTGPIDADSLIRKAITGE